jgi:hypothetical protein
MLGIGTGLQLHTNAVRRRRITFKFGRGNARDGKQFLVDRLISHFYPRDRWRLRHSR